MPDGLHAGPVPGLPLPAAQLEAWFSARLNAPDLRIHAVRLLPGGAVQHNWRVDIDTGRDVRGFVLRAGPRPGLPESHPKAVEFAYLLRAHGAGVPVPEPLWLSDTGAPFLVTALVPGDARREPLVARAENAPLSVLPAGNPVQVPRELFRSDEMSRFIYDISSRYSDRLVIVDTPPLLVTAEAPVLANHADQILIVVQASRTAQSAVEEAVDILAAEDNVSLVLNRCGDSDRLTTPGYYGYGYYQQRAALPDVEDRA